MGAAHPHEGQEIGCGSALVAQARLCLLPKRLVHIVGNLMLLLGIDEARQLGRRDRNLSVLARRVGEVHNLVGSAIQGVHSQHITRRLDRHPAHYGKVDNILQSL